MIQASKQSLSIVNRILNAPDLVRQVQSLAAPALLRIIRKIGLEDSAELLALATSEQLTKMIDEDLWRPGSEGEELDPERLVVWLGALCELGSSRAAERLAEMDEEFLCHALGHYLYAIDLEAAQFMRVNVIGDSFSDERLEKLLEDCHSQELSGTVVIAKQGAPWEYLQPLLLDLDSEDQSLCARVLYRLQKVTEAKAEKEGGIFELLSEEEMLSNDASFSRDQRRTRDGFVSANDAKAFLGWIQATPQAQILHGADPVSKEYFKQYKGVAVARSSKEANEATNPLLLEMLGEEESRLNPLRLTRDREATPFTALLASRPLKQEQLLMELNFLAQVLLRADPALREQEAAECVIAACELGLSLAGDKGAELSAVQLFGLGSKKK